MEFGVYVIHPTNRKSRLKCSGCSLSYSVKDYKILFDNKKLVYFKYTPPEKKRHKVLCHDCLFKTISKDSEGDSCSLNIIDSTAQVQYNCEFNPENPHNEASGISGKNLPEPTGIWPYDSDF